MRKSPWKAPQRTGGVKATGREARCKRPLYPLVKHHAEEGSSGGSRGPAIRVVMMRETKTHHCMS
jgi:hypothetical protein